MRRWRAVLVIVLLLGALIAVYFYIGMLGPGLDFTADHASFRTNPWGTKALRELAESNGLTPTGLERPFHEFSAPPTATLCIFDPTWGLTDEEIEALVEWIRQGGHVIFAVGDDEEASAGDCGGGACGPREPCDPNRAFLSRLGLGTEAVGPGEEVVTVRAGNQAPWTTDVTRLKINAARRLVTVSSTDEVEEQLREAANEDEPVPETAFIDVDRLEPVVADATGVLVMDLRLGQGSIQVISDADMLANGQLGEADNAILAMNLIYSRGRPTALHFDEYHHGQRARPAAGERLPGAPIFAALWTALGCLGLYLGGSFWRFGRPVPLAPQRRRSIIEHVQAFATLYHGARAGGATVDMAARRLWWRLGELTALGRSASPEDMAAACARTADIDAEALARLLTELQGIHPDDKLAPTTTFDLIRRIARFEEAIFGHGRRRDRGI